MPMKKIKHNSQHAKTGDTDRKSRKPGCANFDYYYDGCLFRDECLVQHGKRCEYFERAVLPTVADS